MADLITQDQIAAIGKPFGPVYSALADSERAALITDASAAVESFCRRTFGQQSYVETYDGRNLPRVWLRQLPVIAVAAVSVNGEVLDNTYGDAWSFDSGTGELRRGSGHDDVRFAAWFPAGRGNVQVTYTAGYLEIPPAVQRATILTVRYLYELGRKDWLAQSESIGDYSYTLAQTALTGAMLPPHVAGLLADWVYDDGPF